MAAARFHGNSLLSLSREALNGKSSAPYQTSSLKIHRIKERRSRCVTHESRKPVGAEFHFSSLRIIHPHVPRRPDDSCAQECWLDASDPTPKKCINASIISPLALETDICALMRRHINEGTKRGRQDENENNIKVYRLVRLLLQMREGKGKR